MREINCNIIQDLLPSYMDKICSEDSRLLVEEHLDECEQCRTRLELMRSTELTDGQGEQRRISYMKKVKRYYISFILLVLFMTGGVWFMIQHYEIINSSLFYVIFPLLLIAVYCLLPDSPMSAKQTGISRVLIIVSIVLIMIYFSVLIYWVRQIVRTESGPFGIPLSETGYYMDMQLQFIIVMQLVIFVTSNILIFSDYHVNKCIYGLALTGMYLSVGCICLLHNMTTMETFYGLLLKMTINVMLEGVVFSAAAYFLAKRFNRHSPDKQLIR